jgi:hypothetical protein
MKETKREKRDPSTFVVADTMNKKKGGSKATVHFTRDCVHHTSSMRDSEEPVRAGHLFLSEIGSCHMNHHFPMRFNETIRRLAFSRSRDNLGAVVDEILRDGSPK